MIIQLLILIFLISIIGIIFNTNSIEHFSKIIKPTCHKPSIFGAIRKLEGDVDEIAYLLEKKKEDNKKYDEMYNWYKHKSKSEKEKQKELQQEASRQMDNIKDQIFTAAKENPGALE